MIDAYIDPKKENLAGTDPSSVPTDFFSLTSLPPEPSELPEVGGKQKTDFASLQAGIPFRPEVIVNNTFADHVVNAMTPCLIFLLSSVVLLYLLNVRIIYTDVFDLNLRVFAISFVLGIVSLNRLIARHGSQESYLYVFGLFMAVALYTLITTGGYDVGSVARQFLNENMWVALFLNMSVVTAAWWMVNRLTHECCVDESAVAGDIGIFTATAARMRQTLRRMASDAPPSRETRMKAAGIDEPWHALGAYDPSEPLPRAASWRETVRQDYTDRLPARHPGMALFYFSIPVMLVFILGLYVLQRSGMPAVRMGAYYVGVYTFCVLILLSLTCLRQLRAYFNVRGVATPAALSWLWMGASLLLVLLILWLAARLPMPDLPPNTFVEGPETVVFTVQTGRVGTLDMTPPTLSFMERYNILAYVETGARVVMALILCYAALKVLSYLISLGAAKKSDLSPLLSGLITGLAWLLFKLWPSLFRWTFPKRRIRIQRGIALSARYDNPLGRPDGSRMPPRAHIAYAYDALRALATDIGAPPKESQTPYEFLAHFPAGLRNMREEAEEIIRLYVIAAYSSEEMNLRLEDRLRKFWLAFRVARNHYVR